jgi:hypothetical protein
MCFLSLQGIRSRAHESEPNVSKANEKPKKEMDILMGKEIFEWKGKKLTGYQEVVETALKLEGAEQEEFVEAYCRIGTYARQNMGYVSGYYDRETADKIMKIFKTSHPIFGTTHPAPEDAFEMGKRMAQDFKNK